jgi:hypothetical protein
MFNFSNFYPKIKQNILWIMNKKFNAVWVTNFITYEKIKNEPDALNLISVSNIRIQHQYDSDWSS